MRVLSMTEEERKELERCFSNCPCCDDETVQSVLNTIRRERRKEVNNEGV